MTVPLRRAAGAAAVLLALMLAGCLLAPGRFVSALDIRKDRSFTFSYTGDIHILPLSKLGAKPFEPQPCYDDQSMEERACTAKELAEQRATADERQKQEAESAKALFGGIEISDPRAADELAERLRRQTGWRKVEHKGNGRFEVDFLISGTLDHDFVFPTIERFAMANDFVQLAVRADGTVRVDAPGFGPAAASPLAALMNAAPSSSEANAGPASDAPEIDGTFTIRTDGAILANKPDEGPKPDPAGQTLQWKVNARIPAAPTALIQLGR